MGMPWRMCPESETALLLNFRGYLETENARAYIADASVSSVTSNQRWSVLAMTCSRVAITEPVYVS